MSDEELREAALEIVASDREAWVKEQLSTPMTKSEIKKLRDRMNFTVSKKGFKLSAEEIDIARLLAALGEPVSFT